MKEVINCNLPPERILQSVAIELSKSMTTNAILMQHQKPSPINPRTSNRNFVLSAGAPAEILTVGEAMEQRRNKMLEEQTKIQERLKRKERLLLKKEQNASRSRTKPTSGKDQVDNPSRGRQRASKGGGKISEPPKKRRRCSKLDQNKHVE